MMNDDNLREFASANARDTDADHDFGDHFAKSFASVAVSQHRLYKVHNLFAKIVIFSNLSKVRLLFLCKKITRIDPVRSSSNFGKSFFLSFFQFDRRYA